MKNVLKLALVFVLVFTSCTKDNNEDIDLQPENAAAPVTLVENLTSYARTAATTNQEEDFLNSEDGECFVINYPYSFTDGQTSTVVNNDAELAAYLQSQNQGGNFAIEYPFNVTLGDGTVQTIATIDEFAALIEACDIQGGSGDDNCFILGYPVTVVDEDGTEYTANSEEDFYTLPDVVSFVFPITGTLADGTAVTVEDADAFDSIYNDCNGYEDCTDCEVNCFELVYPLTLVEDNGTVVTIDSDDAFWTYLESLDPTTAGFALSYPVTVELEDGTQQTVNSNEEFDAILDACYN
ncbi:hypothetical protein [Lacinutrix salivirga]